MYYVVYQVSIGFFQLSFSPSIPFIKVCSSGWAMCAAGSTRTQLSSSLCEDNWGIPLIIAVFCVDWSGLCKIVECCCAVAGNTLLKRLLLLLVIGLNSLHFLKERILSWSIVVYSEIIDQWMNYSLSFQFSFSSVTKYKYILLINNY